MSFATLLVSFATPLSMMMHVLLNLAGILILLLTLPLMAELTLLTAAALVFALRFDLLRIVPTSAQTAADHSAPSLIILIPAHNESRLIARTIASLQAAVANSASAYPTATIRIIVIAHNCTDATAAEAAKAGAEVLDLNNPSLAGKGNALLYGFTTLAPPPGLESQTAFVVIDADTIVAPELLRSIQQAIAAGAEAVQCRYEAIHYNDAGQRKSSLAALGFRAFNVVRARGRAQFGISCGLFGNGFALRADLLRRVPYNAHSVVEDLEYHLDLLRAGITVQYLDHARLQGEITGSRSQKSRWDGGRARMARERFPSLAGEIFRHGRLNLVEPAFYLGSLPLAQGVLLWIFALILPLHWLRITASLALVLVLLHIVATILAGDRPAEDLKLLFRRLPMFFVAKIAALPATFRSARTNADWVRTSRDDLNRDAPEAPNHGPESN